MAAMLETQNSDVEEFIQFILDKFTQDIQLGIKMGKKYAKYTNCLELLLTNAKK